MNNLAWLTLSVLLLLSSHVLRAARMVTLFPADTRVRRLDLLLGLAMSYAVNTVIPFRLGESIRILYVGRRGHVRYSSVAATVFTERISDLIVVGLLSLGLSGMGVLPRAQMLLAAASLLSLALLGIAGAIGIQRSGKCRRYIGLLSSAFSAPIKAAVLNFFWSFSELITGGLIRPLPFLVFTPLMWVGYAVSYYSFARATGMTLSSVAFTLLGSPLQSTAAKIWSAPVLHLEATTLLFTLIPVYTILAVGVLRERTSIIKLLVSMVPKSYAGSGRAEKPVSERYKQDTDYNAFLSSSFSAGNKTLMQFSMFAIGDAAVQRLLPGGSDALTAVVERNGELVIRKFATGGAAEKLRLQADWLRAHRDQLPLVDVSTRADEGLPWYCYDMPYRPAARDFYDVIHTSDLDRSRRILDRVIDMMFRFHAKTEQRPAGSEAVRLYLSEKATCNARLALAYSASWFTKTGHRYLLNDRQFDLSDWTHFFDPHWLSAQITDRRTARIHGDLTVENIIIDGGRSCGFYLIDPNPANIFNSPLIDWAKLMQSLNLGYEAVNKAPEYSFADGSMSLVLTRSQAYGSLHLFCRQRLRERLGPHAEREIAFHELVNYLRLTPYKFRQSVHKGMAFFSCTSLLLRNYLEAYG